LDATTGKVPTTDWSVALREIVNCVVLTNVAACPTPLYVTVEVARKFAPFSVKVCAPDPTAADAGDKPVRVGPAAAIVSVRVAFPVPSRLVAFRVTVEVSIAVGVPEIKPVPLLTVKPTGNPVAP
jgi:hypothetical protein